MKITAIITCAGKGERAGLNKNKMLGIINGESVIYKTAKVFDDCPFIDDIVITAREEDLSPFKRELERIKKPISFVLGGLTRANSIKNALKSCECDIVFIHDGARPFITQEVLERLKRGVEKNKSAICAIPSRDSVCLASGEKIDSYLKRENVYLIQTPQCFYLKDILYAYSKAKEEEIFLDDGSVYEKYVRPAHIVLGNAENIKLTYKEDFKSNMTDFYTGIGYDVHRFIEGRPLILGGVNIPHDKGLDGHSDADCLIHAVMDALLSACGLYDIGYYFKNTDESIKGISSLKLLEKVMDMLSEKGMKVKNLSAFILAEEPKLMPHIDKMKENLSFYLGIDKSNIGLTCTTMERMGAIGRREGISAQASVLCYKE